MNRQDILDALIGEGKIPVAQKLVDVLAETSRKFRAIEEFQARPEQWPHACCCIGKRYGEPRCPCAMAYVVKIDGWFYEISTVKVLRGTKLVAERI